MLAQWEKLTQTENWAQLLILGLILILAYFVSKFLYAKTSEKIKSFHLYERLLMPVVVLLMVMITHTVLVAWEDNPLYPGEIVKISIPLALAMVIIRSVIFIMRKSIPRAEALKTWGGIISTIIWIGVALYLTNYLDDVMAAFDSVAFKLGERKISLLLIFKVTIAVIVFLMLANWLSLVIEKQLKQRQTMTIRVRLAVTKTIRVILLTLAFIIALDSMGVDLTALAVMGGALGVGIGFGLQRIASNFISGFMLLYDRSIRPGDVITIGDKFGWIQELKARYVVIRDRDGVDTLVPNENLITSQVVNWSYNDRHVRQKLPVTVSYADDPVQVMEIMIQTAAEFDRVLKDPEPVCRLMDFGDHGIKLELRYWITDPEKGVNNIRSDISVAVWKKFQEQGISIPFPQQDVYIKHLPDKPTL